MSKDDSNMHQTNAIDYSNRLLTAVTSLTVEIGKASSKEEVLALIPAWVPKIVPADRASVAFPVDDDHIAVFGFDGNKAIPVGMPLPIDQTFVGAVFSEQKVMRCQDLEADSRIDSQMLASKSLGSCMDAPMINQGRAIGTLNVAKVEKDAYTAEHEALLLHIAAVVAAQLSLLDQFFEIQEKLGTMVAARTAQIEQQKGEIEAAMREAQTANRLKSEFLISISHELRTPMNAIIGFSEIMLDRELDALTKNNTSNILASAETLLTLINDILDLSKIESGTVELDSTALDFRALVEEVVATITPDAQAKNLGLFIRYVPGTPRFVVGDSMRLRQVLMNLVGNAIKFTEEGQVMITIEPGGQGTGGDVAMFKISVDDTGIGVPPEKHELIFERFAQGDGSWNREHGGTGLGLALCKELIDIMDGELGVESEVGAGSRFWFTVSMEKAPMPAPAAGDTASSEPIAASTWREPDAAVETPALAAAPAAKEKQVDSSLAGLQILLVEDNRLNLEVAKANLSNLKAEVTVAENGEEAVARAKEKQFNAILMDCQMPVMDGFEATRIISGMIAAKEIMPTPIIAVTANAMAGDRERCLAAGMDDYVAKPVRKNTLEDVLIQWCTV